MTATVYSVAHMNQLIVDNLHRIRALPFDVVVHLPRSGTIPASLIATYLIKPFCSVDEYCAGIIPTRKAVFSGFERILLVDDSIRTGKQMAQAVEKIKAVKPETKITTFSVYDTFPSNEEVDNRIMNADLSLHKHDDDFYIFPWFMWKTRRLKKVCVDMDGVLCRDCTKDEDDDGPRYAEFLATAEPKFIPYDTHVGFIVTARLDKYKPQTEAWLSKHGITYSKLVMGPWRDRNARKAYGAGRWKGEFFKGVKSPLFIESSVSEAEAINRISGKSVWCVDNQRFYK